MRTAVAITMIVAGVLVVAIPPLSDAWRALMLTRLLEHGATSVNLEGRLEDTYRFGCYVLGAGMTIIGFASSFVPAVIFSSPRLTVAPV